MPNRPFTRTLLILLFAAMLAPGCAPTAAKPPAPRAAAALEPDPPSYYPHQTGLAWTYLAEGESVLTPPYTLTVLGPTVMAGERVVLTRLRGRAVDITYYHRHDDSGVHLLREDRAGYTITYTPPIQELPAEGTLAPGAAWEGQTVATITHDDPKQATERHNITYRYTVLEHRAAQLPAGRFDTYTIELQASDATNKTDTRQHAWFTPYVGYVRLRGDLILTGGNAITDAHAANTTRCSPDSGC